MEKPFPTSTAIEDGVIVRKVRRVIEKRSTRTSGRTQDVAAGKLGTSFSKIAGILYGQSSGRHLGHLFTYKNRKRLNTCHEP